MTANLETAAWAGIRVKWAGHLDKEWGDGGGCGLRHLHQAVNEKAGKGKLRHDGIGKLFSPSHLNKRQ